MNDTSSTQTPGPGNTSGGGKPHESALRRLWGERGIYLILHLTILVLSVYLIYWISRDTFENLPYYEYDRFQHRQFWICLVFLGDFVIEWILAKRKWHYLGTHFIFFLVCIPYQAIIYHFGWPISHELSYIIRYMPLIRSGYILAIVITWFSYSRATGLFFSYLIILLSTVYFASLTFFLFEHGPNPLVHRYQDALWWAAMDVTTVGSNIIAVTTVGRVLSVLLAALGMMMFPIFTVYITNIITRHNKEGESATNMIVLPVKKNRNDTAEDSVTGQQGSQPNNS